MAYLVTQMFLYLLVAVLLGVALGWLIWGNWLMKAADGESEDVDALRAQLDAARAETAEAQEALELCRAARANLQHEVDRLTSESVVAPASASDLPDEAETAPSTKPQGLDAPRGGQPDDLKRIKGIGPKLEALLHSLGYYHFDQLAAWTEDELAWVDSNLEGFFGRATRDAWVPQAQDLANEAA
ncbi:MAG: hypothetical protein AAGA78_01360 [Pseudomonadota bacterium]